MRRFRVVEKCSERVIGEGCVLTDGRVLVAAKNVQLNPMLYRNESKMVEDWGGGCSLEYIDASEDLGS